MIFIRQALKSGYFQVLTIKKKIKNYIIAKLKITVFSMIKSIVLFIHQKACTP